MAHIWATAAYYSRIWVAMIRELCSCTVLQPEAAARQGLQLSSPDLARHQANLMRFLLKCTRCISPAEPLPEKLETAIQTIITIFNTAWLGQQQLVHICARDCPCGGAVKMLTSLIAAVPLPPPGS